MATNLKITFLRCKKLSEVNENKILAIMLLEIFCYINENLLCRGISSEELISDKIDLSFCQQKDRE